MYYEKYLGKVTTYCQDKSLVELMQFCRRVRHSSLLNLDLKALTLEIAVQFYQTFLDSKTKAKAKLENSCKISPINNEPWVRVVGFDISTKKSDDGLDMPCENLEISKLPKISKLPEISKLPPIIKPRRKLRVPPNRIFMSPDEVIRLDPMEIIVGFQIECTNLTKSPTLNFIKSTSESNLTLELSNFNLNVSLRGFNQSQA